PIAASTAQSTVATLASIVLMAPKVLEVQKALEPSDEEMGEVLLTRDKMAPLDVGGPAPPPKETKGLPRHGPPATSQAWDASGPPNLIEGKSHLLLHHN
ncbi:hypothetical protein C0993_010251, partial [Termitomyces sp. T159_Od127]